MSLLTELGHRVVVTGGGCWEWQLSRLPNGYGRVGRGRGRLAHRWVYSLARGPIPAGLCVLHSCDNRACVNPDHLWLGTKRENTQDALHKGRLDLTPPHRKTGWRPGRTYGPANRASKLTAAAVADIRARYRAGALQRELAAEFQVSQPAISAVIRGATWALPSALTR